MNGNERVAGLAQKLSILDAPVGVCILSRDGEFLETNGAALEVLGLTEGSAGALNIRSILQDEKEWEDILRNLDERVASGTRDCLPVTFAIKVGHRLRRVRVSSRAVTDPQQASAVAAVVCCLTDVTSDESFRQFFEYLPAAVYELDEHDSIVRINEAGARLFGFSTAQELQGRNVGEFYADQSEADGFRTRVVREGAVTNRCLELLKQNGEHFFGLVNTFRIHTVGDAYVGREGTIIDITAEENYRRMLNTLPVGTYIIRVNEDGQDIIRDCNQAFATMFEYEGPEEVIGMNTTELFENNEEYNQYIEAIRREHSAKKPLIGFLLAMRTRKGRHIVIEVNTRAIVDSDDNIIGRAGVMRDVSGEVELRKLRHDIGRVLHAYSATLVMLAHTILPTARVLASDVDPDLLIPDQQMTTERLAGPAQSLGRSLEDLIEYASTRDAAQYAFPGEGWDVLRTQAALLKDYELRIPFKELMSPSLRASARLVLDTCRDLVPKHLPKERTRILQRKATVLERACCLLSLQTAYDSILSMGHQVRSLREYVIFYGEKIEAEKVVRVSDLVRKTVANLAEYSTSHGVAIDVSDASRGVEVRADTRSLVRGLDNLLHNAIKYSWTFSERPARVVIRIQTENDKVSISFENYGVPIPKEEIDSGIIFQIGYRGRESRDRGRLGTGVGLTDARDVARRHGGDVTVRSHPAEGRWKSDDYTKPFLTTALMWIPIDE
ncbi:PAS domain-containing protein [PVC group bacterium]|nr:PAS domain-containing protein [PVC group bacterium]